MPDDVELKACPTPWCKESDPYIFSRGRNIVGVTCRTCDVTTGYHMSDAEAVAEWNTRTSSPVSVEEVAKIIMECTDADTNDATFAAHSITALSTRP
jgi:hypothetical protein